MMGSLLPDAIIVLALLAFLLGILLVALVISAIMRGIGFTVRLVQGIFKSLFKGLSHAHHWGHRTWHWTGHTHHRHHHRKPAYAYTYRKTPTRTETSIRASRPETMVVKPAPKPQAPAGPPEEALKPVRLPEPGAPLRCTGALKLPSWLTGAIEGPNLEGAQCCLLGCGGWGCVYKCTLDARNYAVKVSKQLAPSIESGEAPPTMPEGSLTPEASWLYKLNHPNLVRVLGYSRILPVAVYEYAEMGSLRRWIPKTRLPREALVGIAVHVASGLRYLHSRGLVHGDVKPENVLVSGGILKLGDYSGVRSLLEEAERASMGPSVRSHCTPGYCAPEQVYADLASKARRLGYEDRVDVYQLGVLLLEAGTGRVLDGSKRVGMSRGEVASLAGGMDPGLTGLVVDMLEAEPWSRPSIGEVLRRLPGW